MRSKRLSLRSEFAIAVTFVSLVSILLISVVVLRLTRANLEQQAVINVRNELAEVTENNVVTEKFAQSTNLLLVNKSSEPIGFGRQFTDQEWLDLGKKGFLNLDKNANNKSNELRFVFVALSKDDELVAVGKKLDLSGIHSSIRKTKQALFLYVLLYAAILAAFCYFILSKIVLRPIARMVSFTERINDGAFEERVEVLRSDEIGTLGHSLNQMTDRLVAQKSALEERLDELKLLNNQLEDMQSEVIRTEKLASIGQLAAGLAHEVGNPLGAIMNYVDIIKAENSATARKDLAENAHRELHRIHCIIRELLGYARGEEIKVERLEVAALCQSTVIELIEPSKLEGVVIEHDHEADLAIKCDERQFRQVLLNLVINALHAIENKDKKWIRITSRSVTENDHTAVFIEVVDSGAGIPTDTVNKIFDPFFTTKEPGKGTGLGLYMASRVIERFGGTLVVENSDNAGALFRIVLPIA